MSGAGQVILLIEHNEDDILIFRRALKAVGWEGQLCVVDGLIRARAFLTGLSADGERRGEARPDLIVCDMKLPGEDCLEILKWLSADSRFRGIPCVIFAGPAQPDERRTALRLGATAFVDKPSGFPLTCERVKEMLAYLPSLPDEEEQSPA
jgi:CheY-like chemotaxis protein